MGNNHENFLGTSLPVEIVKIPTIIEKLSGENVRLIGTGSDYNACITMKDELVIWGFKANKSLLRYSLTQRIQNLTMNCSSSNTFSII